MNEPQTGRRNRLRPASVAKPSPGVAPHKSCLTGATWPKHCEQPCTGVEPPRKRAQLLAPADETVSFGTQVVADLPQGTPEFADRHDPVGLVDVLRRRE